MSVHSSIVSFTEEDEEFAEKTAGTAAEDRIDPIAGAGFQGSFSKNGKGALCIANDELASDHSGPRTSKGREGFH